MPTPNSGSREQLLQETANSAIKRIHLGIAQSKSSSEPISILPPLVQLHNHSYDATHDKIPLNRQSSDKKVIRISFHPLIHFAVSLGCLPSFQNVDMLSSFPKSPTCGWIAPTSIAILPSIQPVWVGKQNEVSYTLIHGYRTYGTCLHHDLAELEVLNWGPKTKPGQRQTKNSPLAWQAFLESSTLPALIDIFSTCLYPQLFDEEKRVKLIFWLDTLGLLSLLFQCAGKGSSKRAALAAADLPESTYNVHTRQLRQRQEPLPSPPTPSSHHQKRDPHVDMAPTTGGANSDGPTITSIDNATNTELPHEEEEKERSDDRPKYGKPLF